MNNLRIGLVTNGLKVIIKRNIIILFVSSLFASTSLAQAQNTSTLSSASNVMQIGQAVYEKNCAICHKSDGMGIPSQYPALKNSPVAIGPVESTIVMVLQGKEGTPMQAFGKQLSPTEIAAVVTYIRNAWGNATSIDGAQIGGVITPGEVINLANEKLQIQQQEQKKQLQSESIKIQNGE